MGSWACTRRIGVWPAALLLVGFGCSSENPDADGKPATGASSSSSASAPGATSAANVASSAPGTSASASSNHSKDSSAGDGAAGDASGTDGSSSETGTPNDAGGAAPSSARSADAASGDVTADASADAAQPPSTLAGLVATIGGRVVEFRKDMLTYNGRPPTMDVFASSEDATWSTLRVFVAPDGQVPIAPGEYACGLGQSYVMLIGSGAVYDSNASPGTCTIQVIDPGVTAGEVFSGTFSGTLVKSDGSSPLTISKGAFYGILD